MDNLDQTDPAVNPQDDTVKLTKRELELSHQIAALQRDLIKTQRALSAAIHELEMVVNGFAYPGRRGH